MSEEGVFQLSRSLRLSPAFRGIPSSRMKLLFLSDGEPAGHFSGMSISITVSLDGNVRSRKDTPDDPSTIYSSLDVRFPLADESVSRLPYYPSYSGMTPAQRGTYLNWLSDTSQEIEVGYVFVFFYGLERQLALNNFDDAFEELLHLREVQKHPSFQGYAASALLHGCLLRKKPEHLRRLYAIPDFTEIGNSTLLAMFQAGLDLPSEVLLRIAERMPGVNRKYLRENRINYLGAIERLLQGKFGKPEYPFSSRFNVLNMATAMCPVFANVSLPPEIRTAAIPDILRDKSFQAEVGGLFEDVHAAIKAEKAKARKSNTSTKSKASGRKGGGS